MRAKLKVKVYEEFGLQPGEHEAFSEVATLILEAALRVEDPPTLNPLSGHHGTLPAEVLADSAKVCYFIDG